MVLHANSRTKVTNPAQIVGLHSCLRPLMTFLKVTGYYHEFGYYDKFSVGDRSRSASAETNSENSEIERGTQPYTATLMSVYNKTQQQIKNVDINKTSKRKVSLISVEELSSDEITTTLSTNPSQTELNIERAKENNNIARISQEKGGELAGDQKNVVSHFNMDSMDSDNHSLGHGSYPSKHRESFLCRSGIVQSQRDKTAQCARAHLDYDADAVGVLEKEIKTGSRPPKRSWIKAIFSDRTYAVFVLIILWAYLLRCVIYIHDDRGVSPMTSLTPTSWMLLVACTNTAGFYSSVKKDHFHEFFMKLTVLYQDSMTSQLGLKGTSKKTFIWVTVIGSILTVVINVSSLAFVVISDDSFSGGFNRITLVTGERTTLSVVFSVVICAFCLMAWISPVAFIYVISNVIVSLFEEFSQVMKIHISASGDGFPLNLIHLRERHLAMCDAVDVMDRHFRVAIGLLYSVSIPNACLLLYLIIYSDSDPTVMSITAFWLICNLVFLAVVTLSTANVSIAMHSVSSELQTVQTQNISLTDLAQLLGLYLTYAVILLQFK